MQVYKTRGVCSQAIQFELDGDTIKHVNFIGGCSGNTQGVARLVEGMKVKDAIARLEGTTVVKTNFLPGSAGKGIKRSSKYFDPIMIAIE